MNSDRIQGAAQDIGGKVQQTVGMATGNAGLRAEGVAREISGKGQYLYGQARESVRDATDSLRDAADTVSGYAEDAYERGSRYVQHRTRSVETQVAQHPLTAIVLAGAAGLMLGLLISQGR